MRFAFTLTLLLACSAVVVAQQPDPAPQPQPQSIDSLLVKWQVILQQEADLQKQKAATKAAILAEQKRLQDAIDKAGLNGPNPPMPPDPGPNPKPPEPAPPPAPVDALKAKLKAAYESSFAGDPTAKDAAAEAERVRLLKEKCKEDAKSLAALYRQAAKLATDATVATSGDLLSRVRDAAKILVGEDAVTSVRRVAGAELALLLPTDADLTAEQRVSVAALFGRLAAALEELAK